VLRNKGKEKDLRGRHPSHLFSGQGLSSPGKHSRDANTSYADTNDMKCMLFWVLLLLLHEAMSLATGLGSLMLLLWG